MHRVWVLAAALSAGCFSKPGFSGSGGDGDGGPGDGVADSTTDGTTDSSIDAPPPCTTAWPTPMAVSGLTSDVSGEPTVTGDLKELYWTYQDGQVYELRWAEVSDLPMLAYTYKDRTSFDTDAGVDRDPSITDDGLLLVYRVGMSEVTARMEQVERANRMSAWGPPSAVPGLGSIVPSTLDISGDGLTIYYNEGQTLRHATRSSRTASFVVQPAQLGTNLQFPAISGDELTIYVTTNFMGVDTATRPNKGSAFGGKSAVFTDSMLKDPDVTADGKAMVVATRAGNTIAISRRMCP
jgi:hypothetical protein